MLANTAYSTLTGDAKVNKAAELRQIIADMIDSLDIDGSSNGTDYDLTDIQLIYNYKVNGGKATTATGNTRMLANTPYSTLSGDAKVAKAAELRQKIADLID